MASRVLTIAADALLELAAAVLAGQFDDLVVQDRFHGGSDAG